MIIAVGSLVRVMGSRFDSYVRIEVGCWIDIGDLGIDVLVLV